MAHGLDARSCRILIRRGYRAAPEGSMLLRLILIASVAGCATAKTNAQSDGAPGAIDSAPGTIDSAPGTIDSAGAIDALQCAKSPCSMVPQCGCGANMACDLDTSMLATGATACRAAGVGTEATTCSLESTCTAGYGCIGGHCRKWCADDTTCAAGGSGAICVIQVVYGTPAMNVPGAITCSTDCDPTAAAPAGGPTSWGCNVYYSNPDGVVGNADDKNFTDCDPAGTAAAGGTCTSNANCPAAMDCISFTDGTMSCHPTCLCPSGNCAAGSCPSGTGSCHAFNPAANVGTREYGTCF
jgi:hypothetical protein